MMYSVDRDARLEDADSALERPCPSCMRPSTDDAAAIKPQSPARMPVWKSGACIGGPSTGPTSFIKPVSARMVESVASNFA